MVSLLSGNPRENVAFGTARGQERPTSDNEGTQRSLAAVEQHSTIFSNLTPYQPMSRATSWLEWSFNGECSANLKWYCRLRNDGVNYLMKTFARPRLLCYNKDQTH